MWVVLTLVDYSHLVSGDSQQSQSFNFHVGYVDGNFSHLLRARIMSHSQRLSPQLLKINLKQNGVLRRCCFRNS